MMASLGSRATHYLTRKMIRMGVDCRRPFLGFLWPPDLADKVPVEPLGAEINNLADAADQAEISYYCFALRDVRPQARSIDGWVREDGRWSLRRVPWPDVFYDQVRASPRGQELRALHALYTSATPINTARALGKHLTFQMLERYPDVRPMLPETVLFQQPRDLSSMLDKYHRVYLKPEWGSNGQGISRVWREVDGLYRWTGAVSGLTKTGCTFEEVLVLVGEEGGHGLLVVQQEIPLFAIDGQGSDMRIGVRKDRAGHWCFDPARTRVMRPGGITTNWARGAAWTLFPEGLDYYVRGGVAREQLWQRLQTCAVKLALRLEESIGPMGELGFDLAFDHELNIWLVEANPMPNRPLYDTIDGVIHPVYTRIVDYAIYLYEQRQELDLS